MSAENSIFIDKNSDVGILLLHGFSGTPNEVKDLGEYLANFGFTIYAPTMAGHGTKPDDLLKIGAKEWEESVKQAYLKLREKTKKVFLIGNSFGSNMAFWLIKEFNNEPIGVVSLSAPIYMKYHKFVLFRIYTYGWFKKYYRKPLKAYVTPSAFVKCLFTKKDEELKDVAILAKANYQIIPIKSIKEFLRFIKKETIPNLKKITTPIFVAHAKADPVILSKSAEYIYNHVASQKKEFFWFPHKGHIMTYDAHRQELFERIYNFIKQVC